jgi:hypothetical protein
MPLLYYWKPSNYYKDLDEGASYNLNHSNPLLHGIETGDSLWAFTRNTKGDYVLAAELIIKSKTFNKPDYKYGLYRVWGDLNASKYFDVEAQPSIESVLRSFNINAKAKHFGQSFQGYASIRKIEIEEHRMLSKISEKLPLEKRAVIIPDDKIENEMTTGDGSMVKEFLEKYETGISVKRKEYLIRNAPIRNRNLAKELVEIYSGSCQICKWKPKNIYGVEICETHHIQWISRGGADDLTNLVLICPNHHRAIHKCDASFDYKSRVFDFGYLEEKLQLNKHL